MSDSNPQPDESVNTNTFDPTRANCFMRVGHYSLDLGTIEFKLYDDIVPNTARNFRKLCTGEKKLPNISRPLHYLHTQFHRIVNGFMVQGGDITIGNGTGGFSIFGRFFPDENFVVKHDKPYLLSMANNSRPNTNSSQFFITTRECPHLDNKHVVFGEVVGGFDVVDYLDEVAVNPNKKPFYAVTITNCGIVKPGMVFTPGDIAPQNFEATIRRENAKVLPGEVVFEDD